MTRRYADVIGNWGPNYGYPGPAMMAFGADNGGGDPNGGMVVPPPPGAFGPGPGGFGPGGFPGGGFGGYGGLWPWCGGPPADFSNRLEPNRIPAVALGAACGPLALRKPLGFDRKCIPGCGRATLTANPQEWYKIVRLVISPAIAPSVCVTGFTVGIQNMLSSCGGCVPGSMFAPDAECTSLNGFTAFPNQMICLELENLTEQDIIATAGLIGDVLSGPGFQLYGSASPGC